MAEKDKAHKEQKEASFASHKAQEAAMGERLMDFLKKSEELELVKHDLEKKNQALTHELNSTKERLPFIETTLKAHAELHQKLEAMTQERDERDRDLEHTCTELANVLRIKEKLEVETLSMTNTMDVIKEALETSEKELKITQKDLVKENEEHMAKQEECDKLRAKL
eukprot:4404710-Pyramimonas_sp.AAC.1